MSDFATLWDDAGASAETQAAEQALETAKVATAGLWPFLALATDEVEFGQRLDLASDRITAAASRAGANPTDLVAAYTRQFNLLAEARQVTAASTCAHCGHASTRHSDGAQCHCGCSTFIAGQKTSAIEDVCPACGKPSDPNDPQGMCPDHTHLSQPYPHQVASPHTDADDGYEGTGSGRYASIKQALEEGVDPLEWLEEVAPPGPGTPEKPGGHTTTNEQITPGSPDETPDFNRPEAGRRPFDRQGRWFGKNPQAQQAPAAPAPDPLAGRAACPNCNTRQTAAMPQPGYHKCWNCSGVFKAAVMVRPPFSGRPATA